MNKYKAYTDAANDPHFMQESESMNPSPKSKYPVDPMWEVTSKYYIDRMWEEYHKVKNDLAAVRIDASSAWQEYHKMKEELAGTKSKLGQMDDYVNEVLKPQLAEAKLKLKMDLDSMYEDRMAQSAWDELDKSHAARAKLHDELVIAEGQRDQWKMRAEKAEVERGVDMGLDCAVCTTRIYGTMIGAGDGAGQKFAHPECYYRTCLDVAKSERDALLKVDDVMVERAWQSIADARGVIQCDEYGGLLPSPYIDNVERSDIRDALYAALEVQP
jgi:hypothetical protein